MVEDDGKGRNAPEAVQHKKPAPIRGCGGFMVSQSLRAGCHGWLACSNRAMEASNPACNRRETSGLRLFTLHRVVTCGVVAGVAHPLALILL